MRPEELVFDNFHAIFPQRIHESLFSADFYAEVKDENPYRDVMNLYEGRGGKNDLDRLLYVDQKTYLGRAIGALHATHSSRKIHNPTQVIPAQKRRSR